jgi:hypothetical protein
MQPFQWQCPHCNHHSTITSSNFLESKFGLTINNADGYKVLHSYFIVCPNIDCNKFTLATVLFDTEYEYLNGSWKHSAHKEIKRWNLVPNSFAKVFPNYIPNAIIKDYEEACSIIEDSPKASATLSRRCLQGMIRNYWEVKGANLFQEIESIKDKVDPLTWRSIDATRKIGNIGAHMEKDINLIINVDHKEAKALIKLIEVLIKDWYINRHERELMLQDIIDVGDKKQMQKAKKKD